MNKYFYILAFCFSPMAYSQFYGYGGMQMQYTGNANPNLAGSGYWGGQQNCSLAMGQSMGQSMGRTGNSKAPGNDDDKNVNEKTSSLKKDLKSKQLDKKRAESELEFLAKKIERYFDPEIMDFLIGTHIDKMNKCDDYKTFPGLHCESLKGVTSSQVADAAGQPISAAVVSANCGGKDDVPEKLKKKWTTEDGNGFCAAVSTGTRGAVKSSICSDASLRPSESSKLRNDSATECSKALADYRKKKVDLDNAQAKIEKIEDEIEHAELTIADETERARISKQYSQKNTEGTCEDCMEQGRGGGSSRSSNRDWTSTITNVAAGLGLMWYGKKSDDRTAEYNAQLGYPTTGSFSPYTLAGASMMVSGIIGSNNNCGQTIGGNSGAFGYPQQYTQSNQYSPYTSYSAYSSPYSSAYSSAYSPYASYSMYPSYLSGQYSALGAQYGGSIYGSMYASNYGSQYGSMYGSQYGQYNPYSQYSTYSQYPTMYNQYSLYSQYNPTASAYNQYSGYSTAQLSQLTPVQQLQLRLGQNNYFGSTGYYNPYGITNTGISASSYYNNLNTLPYTTTTTTNISGGR